MTTIGEANRRRMCLDCGEPGARLFTDRTDRILRVCDALRRDSRTSPCPHCSTPGPDYPKPTAPQEARSP